MAYRTTCPRCGGDLRVVSFRARTSIPLSEDGFSTQDADFLDTEDEVVECPACFIRGPLCDEGDDCEMATDWTPDPPKEEDLRFPPLLPFLLSLLAAVSLTALLWFFLRGMPQ